MQRSPEGHGLRSWGTSDERGSALAACPRRRADAARVPAHADERCLAASFLRSLVGRVPARDRAPTRELAATRRRRTVMRAQHLDGRSRSSGRARSGPGVVRHVDGSRLHPPHRAARRHHEGPYSAGARRRPGLVGRADRRTRGRTGPAHLRGRQQPLRGPCAGHAADAGRGARRPGDSHCESTLGLRRKRSSLRFRVSRWLPVLPCSLSVTRWRSASGPGVATPSRTGDRDRTT